MLLLPLTASKWKSVFLFLQAKLHHWQKPVTRTECWAAVQATTVCDLWPHHSSTDGTNQTASSWRCHTPTPIYPMTVQFTSCDTAALEPTQLAGSHFHSLNLIVEHFDGKLPCITVVAVFTKARQWNSKKLFLWKGNLPHNVFFKASLMKNHHWTTSWGDKFYEQSELFFWLFRPFSWLLCLVRWQGNMSVIVFGSEMVEGPTDKTTVGLS